MKKLVARSVITLKANCFKKINQNGFKISIIMMLLSITYLFKQREKEVSFQPGSGN